MRRFAVWLAAVAMVLQPLAYAQSSDESISWLSRIASSAQRLNYSGTFIYQSGHNIETSRITHVVDEQGERERLEVLDGSPREVIRKNDEVWCVFPEQKTVITDRSTVGRAFPARLPEPPSFAGIAENYQVSAGGVGRVAGLEAQMLILEPRDNLRYGHRLWAERDSGLLLKARMVDERGDVIEQFTFTEIRIGGEIDDERLKPHYKKDDAWRVVSAHGDAVRSEDSGWDVANPLPGYRLKSTIRRPLGRDEGDVLHFVFSDGLASISVFVEPVEAERANELGPLATGAINIYRRVVDGHLVTALGEVPLRALQRLGDGMMQTSR